MLTFLHNFHRKELNLPSGDKHEGIFLEFSFLRTVMVS